MKILILSIYCVLITLSPTLFAQKVEIEGEDVLVNGASWCKIYKTKGILESDFTLGTPAGKKFLFLKYSNESCIATWMGKGISTKVGNEACFPKMLVKQLYSLDVLEDGMVNESALQDFFAVSGASASLSEDDDEEGAVTGSSGSSGGYELVERDRSKDVSIFGETIRQDFTDIGTINKNTSYSNGQSITEYVISLPNGQMVATVKFAGLNSVKAEIITAKDNKRHLITCGSTLGREEDAARYLIRLLYL
jgi:hypothetical protein